MADGFIDDLVKLETEGVVTNDAHLRTDVLVISPVITVMADNPRASEILSHMGSTANKFCRMCMVKIHYQF